MTVIAQEVIQARVDHVHFSILFYFYTEDIEASLPSAVWKLRHFAEEGLANADATTGFVWPPVLLTRR